MRLYPNGLYGSLLDSSFQAPARHGANSHLPSSYNAGFCFSLSYLLHWVGLGMTLDDSFFIAFLYNFNAIMGEEYFQC
jgi:hypothetical protein